MKQIFSSIIAHSGRSIGLIIEIIIITVIGWIVIEPVAVLTTIANIPSGYDHDRLVNVSFSSFSKSSEEYDSLVPNNREPRNEAYDRLLDLLRKRQGVEKATFNYTTTFESGSYAGNSVKPDSATYYKDGEDNDVSISTISYKPGTDFFSTFGIKDVNGKPFTEPQNDGNSAIITQSVAKVLYPDGRVIGKNLFNWVNEDGRGYPIIGITQDVLYRKGAGRNPSFFQAVAQDSQSPEGVTMRLGEGVNPRAFLDKLTTELSDYRSGNTYITHPRLLSDMRYEIFSSGQRILTQKWIIVIFFLGNMFLGIAGSFYVQCKSRIPDAGVMRAFGATRSRIEWSIIAEACIITFIGWLIGSVLYLIYLIHQGFPYDLFETTRIIRIIRPLWFDTPLSRYSVIGGIILVLLLVTSALGAWFPARRVGRVPIVDSLRDKD